MTRPPSANPAESSPPGDDRRNREHTSSLERELGAFFAAPIPPDLRARVVARSSGYRRERRQLVDGREAGLIERTETASPREETMPPVLPAPTPMFREALNPGLAPPAQQQVSPPRGIRRVGRDSLGLVASLALIVLVAVSAFAVYGGPSDDGPEPTRFQGAAVGTPTATADATATDPVYGTTDDGTAYVRVPYGDCTGVEPMTFDDAMEIIYGDDYPFESQPPAVEIATSEYFGNALLQWTFSQLPAGDVPDQSVVDAVMQTYSLYRGCENTRLRTANLLTPEGLVREAFGTPGPYLTDGGIDGNYLSSMWADGQGRQSNDADHFGRLTNTYLYDFRLLPDGKVVAFKSGGGVPGDPDALPTFYENAGYILFAERDGQWLIDEQF